MTSDELKQSIKMRDLLRQYGITVDRKGFCCCPFHNEKTGSMKIYDKTNTYHCFGCGASGDVFTFVQSMDNCDFKAAFIKLGGTYKTMSDNERIVANTKRERERKQRELKEAAQTELKHELGYVLSLINYCIKHLEPLTEEWIYCQNKKPYLEEYWDELTSGKDLNEVNVYRACREIRCHFDIGTRIV